MMIIDGKIVSEHRRILLKERIRQFENLHKRTPHLAVVLVGQDLASQVYVRNKEKSCHSVGIRSSKIEMSEKTTQAELNDKIQQLAVDVDIDGILVQLPLPKGLSIKPVLAILPPEKDVDGFTYQTLGRLWAGDAWITPCTPQGVMTMLDYYKIPVAGKYAVVVGRSEIVGKPMAHLLTMANATVTVCHSHTVNLSQYTLAADIVVVAAGKKHLLGKSDFKKGAVVVDVGMHGSGQGQGVTGDVRLDELKDWVQAYTPVPGGVGPMTITTLLENTVTLAEKNMQKK